MQQAIQVPRFDLCIQKSVLDATITESIQELGYEKPTCHQYNAITKFVQGNDVFVSLPTGSGKSLTYASLPIIYDRLRGLTKKTIVTVVSPLTALMQDQVKTFSKKGLNAAMIGARAGRLSQLAETESIHNGEIQLLYISPEALLAADEWRDMFRKDSFFDNLACLAIDEAHLVDKWGESFRTDFLHIGEIRSLLPKSVNVLALTATANISTRNNVIKMLEMHGCCVVSMLPNKLNVKYIVKKLQHIDNVLQPIVKQLIKYKQECERYLIYCMTYDDTLMIFQYIVLALVENEVPLEEASGNYSRLCDKFDACTSETTKAHILDSFTDPLGSLRVVVATVAFAMGLDAPNVRHVIHWRPPEDIEMYVQETGRAGRDGLPCTATLYYMDNDLSNSVNTRVNEDMKTYCKNVSICQRRLLMSHFTERKENQLEVPHPHDCCDICNKSCSCSLCINVLDTCTDGPAGYNFDCNINIEDEPHVPASLSSVQKRVMQKKMKNLREALCKKMPTCYELVGEEICTGITDNAIKNICDNYFNISGPTDLINLGITKYDVCEEILDCLKTFNDDYS